MNPVKDTKTIDYSKLNIGTELECYLVHADSFQEITRAETQLLFDELAVLGWKPVKRAVGAEIHAATKILAGFETEIKVDLCYAIFEIASRLPVASLATLEKIHAQSLFELRHVLAKHNMLIWPFGVAPASSNLFRLPFTSREELIDDAFYKPLRRIETQERLCHITSHQVNIDVPVPKVMATVNALYKNLGNIINRFANSPLFVNSKFYKEGRFYFWNDCLPILNTPRHRFGAKPVFPPREFKNLHDFYSWNWQGEFLFVIRDGLLHTFKDVTTTPAQFFAARRGIVVTPDGDEKEVTLNKDDIELLFEMNWLDFKPHFDFDDAFTVDEFLAFLNFTDIDGFIAKHVTHAYLEIRPCSPHLENNAMDIPRYFYNIFSNLDAYIARAAQIDWEEARAARDRALLA